MGSSASTVAGSEDEERDGLGYPGSVAGLGVGTLVREIGMAMIPAHLKHSYESILQIVETATRLRQFDEAPYNSNLIMLIALLRNAQMKPENQEHVPRVQFQQGGVALEGLDGSRNPHIGQKDKEAHTTFERDRVFGGYATSVYLASWKLAKNEVASSMSVEHDDVLFTWFNDDDTEEHCPKFMILLDHKNSAVVLVIRGTFSFKDVLMDVVCEEAEFLDGFAHKGFMDGSRKVMKKCSKIIEKALTDNFGYELVVCGHSMGGSIAVMITMELLRSSRYSVLPPGISVRCVALGSAPVYRTEATFPDQFSQNICIYVNDKDVVPRLSLGSVAKLLSMLREVDMLGLTLEEQLAIVMWRDDEVVKRNRERVVRAVIDVKQDRFCYLHHPGQVVSLINKGKRVEVHGMESDSEHEIAENMEISETMISDHIHTVYKDTFNKSIYRPLC